MDKLEPNTIVRMLVASELFSQILLEDNQITMYDDNSQLVRLHLDWNIESLTYFLIAKAKKRGAKEGKKELKKQFKELMYE